MAGELDGNAPLDTVLATYREVPDAGLAIIPGAGHPCFLTHFDAVWSAMRRFFGMWAGKSSSLDGCREKEVIIQRAVKPRHSWRGYKAHRSNMDYFHRSRNALLFTIMQCKSAI